MTLPGHGTFTLNRPINGGQPIVASWVVTTGLDRFFGTGILTPDFLVHEGLSVDNPAILVEAIGSPGGSMGDSDYTGTLTVTYYYGPTFPTPAPTSLVMLSLGLLPLAGLSWHRRRSVGGSACL